MALVRTWKRLNSKKILVKIVHKLYPNPDCNCYGGQTDSSQLLENALKMYLESVEKRNNAGRNDVSETTRGAMNISPAVLKAIMEEEGVYETR